MSTDTDQHDDEGDHDQTVMMSRANIRKLEKAAKAGLDAQTRLAALEREMAFRNAGIDPGDKKLSYFVKGYDGDATPDAIKAAAIEAGFLQAQQEQQQAPDLGLPPGVPSTELAAMQRSNATTAGTQQMDVTATAAFHAALAAAKTGEETFAVIQKFLPTPGLE